MSSWGKTDFRKLVKLQKKIEKFQQTELELFAESCAKELAARLLRKVVKRTPVDTGELKKAWAEENSHIHVSHNGNEFVCEIINSQKYAIYVEYGHRTRGHDGWVHGYFMLEKSTLELESQAPKILEKKLMKKLGEIFND